MLELGRFLFGEPILPLTQKDRSKKRIFVLGVYASAVHARWVGADGKQKIAAVAVASEPEIFWTGSEASAAEVIGRITLPAGAGHLVPPLDRKLNGPSGRALDEYYLAALGFSRQEAWLCDLVPYSCMNDGQKEALVREYEPVKKTLSLPAYDWKPVPTQLTDAKRRVEIEEEVFESGADIIVTLGDAPLKWFMSHYGTPTKLESYGTTAAEYGRLRPVTIAGRQIQLLPLVHPRQAAGLGQHSAHWKELHAEWVANHASALSVV